MITNSPVRWLKVWWHCLWRMLSKESHRMCSLSYVHFGRVDFCECGYPDDDQTFPNRLNELRSSESPPAQHDKNF